MSAITADVISSENPIRAQRRQTLVHVHLLIGVAPGAAGVVNADGFVDFDLAGHGFGRRERDFAEGDADVGVELTGEVDLAGVGERRVGGRVSIGRSRLFLIRAHPCNPRLK